jgi:RNA polymerase sigma factor (sigma-70 family)
MRAITPSPSTDAPREEVAAYIAAVHRTAREVLVRIHRVWDADDIASEIALALAADATLVMTAYPDPAVFARVRARHAAIQYQRRQRVQRGEGARVFHHADGTVHPGRTVVSGNVTPTEGGAEWLVTYVDGSVLLDEQLTDQMLASVLLADALDGLAVSEREELYLIDGLGWTVQEVAEWRGQRRETVSRRVNAARRLARERALQAAG